MMRQTLALCALIWLQIASAATVAVEVHPSGATVPENLLRIELRFREPQRLPFDTRRLQLVDSTGTPITNSLLDLALPDAEGRRITVLLDPGRVKTDVGPNLSAGRALQEGSTVRLMVANTSPGEPPVFKQWTVTSFDVEVLRPELWHLRIPRIRSNDALVVNMHQPISSSGERFIAVRDPAGLRVSGRISLEDGDTVWRFTPSRSWQKGTYALVTHPDLEDPAGNRSCAAFEEIRASQVRCDMGVEIPFNPAVAFH